MFLHPQCDGQRYGSYLCYCEICNISSTSIDTVRKMFMNNFEIEIVLVLVKVTNFWGQATLLLTLTSIKVATEAIKGEDLVSSDDVAAAKEDPEEQARQIDPARAARCRSECSCREPCCGSCAHGHLYKHDVQHALVVAGSLARNGFLW